MHTYQSSDWFLLPGGTSALLRLPFPFPLGGTCGLVPKDAGGTLRQATLAEIVAANHGAPYPWGYSPASDKASRMWKEKRIGFGGLLHNAWFVLANGERVGGAPNVPETGPGARRHYLLTTGGKNVLDGLNENEGYALVWEGIPECNVSIYNAIHDHVATHVSADGGSVTISPILKEGETVFVGFVGRCMTCPNPERISIKALQHACPQLNIELHPDWKGWAV